MEKLTLIQQNLKAPKNQFNDFGKYKYRSCEDILEAVKPLLNGCLLTMSDAIVEVGGRNYIEATVKFSDGKNIETVKAYARESETKKGMDESQITGSASSYARKYALNGLFLIDDTKDADTMDNTKPQTEKKSTVHAKTSDTDDYKKLSDKQWDWIKKIATDTHGLTTDELKAMISWKADKENLRSNHWKMKEFLLPDENFEKTLADYSAFMMESPDETGVKGF